VEPPRKRRRREFDQKTPHLALPSTKSPSTCDSSVITKKSVAGGLYSHWLALALYDLYTTTGNAEPTITFKSPVAASVDQIVKSVRSTVALCDSSQECHSGIMHNSSLKNVELTLTALLARALDRFLFPDDILHKGACLHQLPVSCKNHTLEHSDF
jgi:hypothetical protein